MEKTNQYGRVAVIMGGVSSEREISLMSGSGILKALQSRGIDAVAVDPKMELKRFFTEHFDRAYIALHGRFGEDGTIQGILEYLQIPYTGSGVRASAIAIDKISTRTVWQVAGIPVAKGFVATRLEDAEQVLQALGSDVVVKPAGEGSSIGVTKLKGATKEMIAAALNESLKYDREVLVEERVFGRELTVALLNGKALPVIEIKAPEGEYDYQNKYWGSEVHYECPAQLTSSIAQNLAQTAEKAFAVLGARGWGRIDVMMRQDGSFVLLELNTSPGMTPHSLVPMAAKATGLSYEELCEKVLSLAHLDFAMKK